MLLETFHDAEEPAEPEPMGRPKWTHNPVIEIPKEPPDRTPRTPRGQEPGPATSPRGPGSDLAEAVIEAGGDVSMEERVRETGIHLPPDVTEFPYAGSAIKKAAAKKKAAKKARARR